MSHRLALWRFGGFFGCRVLWVGIAVVTVAVGLTAAPWGRQEPWVTLLGETTEQGVRLVWIPTAWPEGVRGFEVRRREATGEWAKVSSTILPGVAHDGDLSNVEPNAEARARLETKRAELLRTGKLRAGTADGFVEQFRKDARSFSTVLRLAVEEDPEVAFLVGLGCTDRAVRRGEVHEYGVFAVRERSDDVPAATYTSVWFEEDDPRLKVTGAVEQGSRGLMLSWSFDDAAARRWGIVAFAVERLGRVAHYGVEGGRRRFAVADETADPSKASQYEVTPLGAFGARLPSRTVLSWTPMEAVPPPTIEELRQDPDRGVVIRWAYEGAADGFRIDRLPAKEDATIGDPISVGAERRECVDRFDLGSEAVVRYRVSVLREGRVASSATGLLVYVNPAAPPPPRGVRAEILPDTHGTVRLRWDASEDKGTERYVVYADYPQVGQMIRQAGVFSGAEGALQLPLVEGREVTLGLAAVSAAGRESARVETKLYVPGRLPPAVLEVSVGREGAALVVRWKVPEAPDVTGFRIYVGATVGVDEGVLGLAVREWKLEPIDLKRSYAVDVRAVSRRGTLSVPARASWSLYGPPGPPREFGVKRTERGALLTWKPPATGNADHYEMAWDEKAVGVFGRPEGIDGEEKEVPLVDAKRSVIFRLWAVGVNGERTRVQTVLLGEGRTLPPALLGSIEEVREDPPGRICLRWEYEGIATLQGFKILHNGVVEATLGRESREWTSAPLESGAHAFQLVAFSEGEESESGPARTVTVR